MSFVDEHGNDVARDQIDTHEFKWMRMGEAAWKLAAVGQPGSFLRKLGAAHVLVFDTETMGFGGSVLNLGWILADECGAELASYDLLWQLPCGERIHSGAFKAHGISAAQVRRNGVAPAPEAGEFFALVAAA